MTKGKARRNMDGFYSITGDMIECIKAENTFPDKEND